MTDTAYVSSAYVWLVHWKHSAGKPLCLVADPASSPGLPGEWLVEDRTEVTCPACLEWLHS